MGYTHGTKWTEDSIKEGVLKVVSDLELDRMPSRKEVESFYGDSALTGAVSKRIGWYNLAHQLGLSIKDSETYFGKKQEQLVREELISMGYEVRRMPQNFPYDLLVNDCVKVDVKSSRLYRGKSGNFYSFNLEKPFCTCDIYVMRLINEDGSVKESLIIPSKNIPTNTQVSVGESASKYYQYRDKWEYINDYCAFMESIS